jgi:hypothetical protein
MVCPIGQSFAVSGGNLRSSARSGRRWRSGDGSEGQGVQVLGVTLLVAGDELMPTWLATREEHRYDAMARRLAEPRRAWPGNVRPGTFGTCGMIGRVPGLAPS